MSGEGGLTRTVQVASRNEGHVSPTTRRVTSPVAAVLISVLLVAVVFAGQLWRRAPQLANAQLSNPDSYYKLVLLMDQTPQRGYGWIARDNAPEGSWLHWSRPHAATVWQLHHALRLAGWAKEPALRYAGGAVTMLSVLLVALFVAVALTRIAPQRAVMVSGLVLATSVPIHSYGRVIQITHHIFMLVPLTAAAACLLQRPEVRRPWLDLCGGSLLGLALWISPETMPFVVGLSGVRLALRLQHPDSAPLWPMALGMAGMTLWAWSTDPPPPGFGAWALDHISLAYIALVALLSGLLVLGDVCARRALPLARSVPTMLALGCAAAIAWLVMVPGASRGPAGLVPEELHYLFWDHVNELRSAHKPAEWVGYLAVPMAAAGLAGYGAYRQRSLWLCALALFALVYGLLGAWHVRMGAAASAAAALAFCAGAASLRGMDQQNDGRLPAREWATALAVALLPHAQLVAYFTLSPAKASEPAVPICDLAPVAEALNRLPPSTVLTALSSGPELLYRSHHRVIAGPYHHNVSGMLDSFRAWRDSGEGRAEEILRRRDVGYVLGCINFQSALQGTGAERSLAQRVAAGDVPGWLVPVAWPSGIDTDWRLYRVQLSREDRHE